MAARAITDTSSDPLHTVPNLPEKADVIRAHTFRETLALAGQTRRAEIAEQIAREAKTAEVFASINPGFTGSIHRDRSLEIQGTSLKSTPGERIDFTNAVGMVAEIASKASKYDVAFSVEILGRPAPVATVQAPSPIMGRSLSL